MLLPVLLWVAWRHRRLGMLVLEPNAPLFVHQVAVLFTGFGASSLDFAIRAWTHQFDDWSTI